MHVDGTDIGSSDHFLVWMELRRATKTSKKKKLIRRSRLNRFGDDEVKLSYQNALRAEVYRFSENIRSKVERGMKGQELVNEVVMEWESVVNRVAKCELGEKMIVCGRQLGSGMSKLRTELTHDGKCIGRLLMVERICGISIVDYVRR